MASIAPSAMRPCAAASVVAQRSTIAAMQGMTESFTAAAGFMKPRMHEIAPSVRLMIAAFFGSRAAGGGGRRGGISFSLPLYSRYGMITRK